MHLMLLQHPVQAGSTGVRNLQDADLQPLATKQEAWLSGCRGRGICTLFLACST